MIVVDLGLVEGLFRAHSGLGYFGVLSKSCGLLRSQSTMLAARNTAMEDISKVHFRR